MIVCVLGLWHLGTVTAACLAEAGHRVIGLDHDASTIAKLGDGIAPIAEPRLDALLAKHATGVTFTAEQQSRLAAVFPSGVCDWTKKGVAQVPARGWTTFAAGPGGRPIDPVPVALGG